MNSFEAVLNDQIDIGCELGLHSKGFKEAMYELLETKTLTPEILSKLQELY